LDRKTANVGNGLNIQDADYIARRITQVLEFPHRLGLSRAKGVKETEQGFRRKFFERINFRPGLSFKGMGLILGRYYSRKA